LKNQGAKWSAEYLDRWAECRVQLKLSRASLRRGDYAAAINWLHEAHNLGRDNVFLHVATHLRYLRFSFREARYRRALGHVFWALTSPLLVPIERKQRTAIVGEWKREPGWMISDRKEPILLVEIVAAPPDDDLSMEEAADEATVAHRVVSAPVAMAAEALACDSEEDVRSVREAGLREPGGEIVPLK
jgi:hypothetical protein